MKITNNCYEIAPGHDRPTTTHLRDHKQFKVIACTVLIQSKFRVKILESNLLIRNNFSISEHWNQSLL